ncbi:MAG: glycosyltransferase [Planctomycetes bacterium]|nr:glycosyltransferase [Planctomycetota bacterium]
MTDPLRIAVVHYHLRPGGVTNVIRNAVASLDPARCRAAILCGSVPDAAPPPAVPVRAVEGLNYARPGEAPDPAALAERLAAAARDALGAAPDVWHIHNHAIGKNSSLARAVRLLAERRQRLLLQIHDFAEDGRPANYRGLLRDVADGRSEAFGAALYPQAGHVHYAVLNSRDRGFLLAAGAAEDRVHLLPNPVALGDPSPGPARGGNRILYPTRAIRRKNLGEFLLWSLLGDPGDRFAVTLAPTSPADRAAYEGWMAFARSLRLPVDFEAGRNGAVPFADLLGQSRLVVTTSVGEGFGLAFLEPWLAERPLAGRDLPELTRDFKEHGLDLGGLYEHLLVPLAWVGEQAFRRRVDEKYGAMLEEYGRTADPADAERAAQSALREKLVDFGRLDEPMQESVIRRLAHSPPLADGLRPPHLAPGPANAARTEHNARVAREQYNLEQYAGRLERIYAGLTAAEPSDLAGLDAGRLLDQFLAPERFVLLRT